MHYAILNSSGNVIEWFDDEEAARAALEEITSESPDADVDLVAFEGAGRPAEPVSASVRSAWPAARLVWSSNQVRVETLTIGNVVIATTTDNATNDRVELERA